MDRLTRSLLAYCGLGLVVLFTGCRSPRSEVPPGRQYMNDGRQVPPVGFSTSPHDPINTGMPQGTVVPGAIPGRPDSLYGPQSSNASSNLGMTTGAAFGPPTTSAGLPGTEAAGSQGASGYPASAAGSSPSSSPSSNLTPYTTGGMSDSSPASAGYGGYGAGGPAGATSAGGTQPR